jgi:hypothetical protein
MNQIQAADKISKPFAKFRLKKFKNTKELPSEFFGTDGA